MKKKTLDFAGEFRVFYPVLIYCAIAIGFVIYLYREEGAGSLPFSILVSMVLVVAFVVPQIVLHLKYRGLSKDVSLEYDANGNRIEYSRGEERLSFSPNDVVRSEVLMTRSFANKTIQVFPWDNYCYVCIELATGKKLLITSLLAFDLELGFPLRNRTLQTTFFPWPRLKGAD